MKPEFAERLVSGGIVKVGTLYEYRDSDDERVDRKEGSRIFQVSGPTVNLNIKTSASRYISSHGLHGGVLQNKHPGGQVFVNERVSRDCYIYCMSKYIDESLRQKWGGSMRRNN